MPLARVRAWPRAIADVQSDRFLGRGGHVDHAAIDAGARRLVALALAQRRQALVADLGNQLARVRDRAKTAQEFAAKYAAPKATATSCCCHLRGSTGRASFNLR